MSSSTQDITATSRTQRKCRHWGCYRMAKIGVFRWEDELKIVFLLFA